MSEIILSPFSNSYVRNWPLGHYARLVGHLLDQLPADVILQVVGTPSQRLRAAEVVRRYPSERVVNACGRLAWNDVVRKLRAAACVVSNNSGLGHLASFFGVPTVCVFGGSHLRDEWRPIGDCVVVISRAIGCSPCQLDHHGVSPYAKACLREIDPQTVAAAAVAIMARVAAKGPPNGA